MTHRSMPLALWLPLLAVAGLGGCEAANDQPEAAAVAEGRLAGNVFYRERMALPPDAVVEIRLEDVSLADAAAVVLAEQTIATEGRQVPIQFELSYPQNRIEANRRYGLRASIRAADGALMFATTTHHPVLAGGAPAQVEILVQRVGADRGAAAAPAPPPDGTWRLVTLQEPGEEPQTVAADQAYTIEFADGRVSGQAHCNRYTGGYEQSGAGNLSISAVATTLAACLPPSQADAFLRAVGTATGYELADDELRLSFGAGGTLTFTREQAPAARGPWAAAASRGVTFRALGNEPSWVLEVYPDRLLVVTDLGATRTEFSYAEPTVEGTTTTYAAANDDHTLTAVIEQRACADSMSGEAFEAAATVTLDEETFRGCGRFL